MTAEVAANEPLVVTIVAFCNTPSVVLTADTGTALQIMEQELGRKKVKKKRK